MKMICQLEHANITVSNIDEAIRFLTTAFPHFRVRGSGRTALGRKWLHLGDDNTYIALNEATENSDKSITPYLNDGLNHLGYVVDDADAVKQRLHDTGYEEGLIAKDHPHRNRIYFHDSSGREWEFVQYFSDDPTERNDYSQ